MRISMNFYKTILSFYFVNLHLIWLPSTKAIKAFTHKWNALQNYEISNKEKKFSLWEKYFNFATVLMNFQ